MSSEIRSHRDLDVYWKALDLVDLIYDLSESFPVWENFGLRSQLTREAVSVPANIAEGSGRATSREFAPFLSTARASLLELDPHLEIAKRRKYITSEEAANTSDRATEVGKMITGLRRAVRRRNRTNHEPLATNHYG